MRQRAVEQYTAQPLTTMAKPNNSFTRVWEHTNPNESRIIGDSLPPTEMLNAFRKMKGAVTHPVYCRAQLYINGHLVKTCAFAKPKPAEPKPKLTHKL